MSVNGVLHSREFLQQPHVCLMVLHIARGQCLGNTPVFGGKAPRIIHIEWHKFRLRQKSEAQNHCPHQPHIWTNLCATFMCSTLCTNSAGTASGWTFVLIEGRWVCKWGKRAAQKPLRVADEQSVRCWFKTILHVHSADTIPWLGMLLRYIVNMAIVYTLRCICVCTRLQVYWLPARAFVLSNPVKWSKTPNVRIWQTC